MMDYLVVDVETIPIDVVAYDAVAEEDKKKFLNPIESKIVAAGIRHNGQNNIFLSFSDEAKILDDFWGCWNGIDGRVVGFNILDFDLPMLVGRSFFNNVEIVPFIKKAVIDLREILSAYKFNPRGTLKEYARFIGLKLYEAEGFDGKVFNGSMVLDLVKANRPDDVKTYLERDLELTDELFKRAEKLNLTKMSRW